MARFKLKDIGTIITGNTPKTSDNRNYDSNDICFVKPSDIDDNELSDLYSSECYISEYARGKARIVPAQSVLVTCIGIIGKVGINSVDCAFNQQINAIIPNIEKCDCRYLAYAIQRERPKLQSIANAPVVPILNKSQFSDIEISLPPLAEQRKIAAVLDKVNNLIAKRRQQLDKLDELVKSRFIEMFGDPQSNPHGYQYAKLSDIATYFNGLTYKPENVAEEGTIVLRSSNIQNSQLDFADTVRVNCAIKKRLMVKENDILMCSRNGSAKLVGKVALIKGIQEPTSFGAFMMIIRSQYFGYLMTYFQMDAFRQQIKTGATTTINQITGRMLDDVTIPLPPMALVEQFTAFVAQTDKSKLAIQKSLEKLEILKKALMQKYFG